MANAAAMTKEEVQGYLWEEYRERPKPNWAAVEINEMVQQH